jgi:molybdopterin converting factor small subunit
MTDTWVSRNLYLAELREKARETERQYSEQAVGAVVDKVSDIGSSISQTAQDSFNRSMESARKRREMEMQFAQEGMTAGDLGRYAEESLAQAAGTVGTALSPITGAAEELTPDLGVSKAIAESAVGQKAGELMKEYPRTTRNTLNALEAGSWFHGAKFLGRTANAVIDNMPTELPGFYSGNPVGAVAKGATGAIPGMFGQLFSPKRQAERRVIGTGRGRRSEYVTNPKQSVVTGSMLANSALDKQYTRTPEGGDNVVQNSAEVQRYVDGSFDVSDQKAIRAGLASLEPDTPDVILDAAMKHWQTVQGIDQRPGGTTAVVRRPLSGEKLSGEATGTATTASSVSRSLASPKTLEAAQKALPDAEGIDFYNQYLTIAKHANNDNVRRAAYNDKLPKGTTGADLQQDYWRGLYNKSQGKKVTEKQQQALDFFEDAKPIKMTDRGDGLYTLQDTTKSAAQDLGGMNQFLAVDVNKDKVWTMGSDGHDLFGVNPAGANDLVNLVPIHSFKVGTKQKYDKAGGVEVNLSRIEELTGMPRNKGESATAYQKRVMRDYEGTAELQDYLEVGKNVVGAGMLTSTVAGVNEDE